MWRELEYLQGFGNEHESEALPGTLPQGQFSPQQVGQGLYAEQFSSTAFTVPRAEQRRTWFYRIQPSVVQGRYEPQANTATARLRTAPDATGVNSPMPLRWGPQVAPEAGATLVESLNTLATNGSADARSGMAVHRYCATRSMHNQYFACNDGELLLIPQMGDLLLATECGRLLVSPGEIALIPAGMKFKVDLHDELARGYVCENYGEPFRLPERGVIGANGLANQRDFQYPVAAFDDTPGECQLLVKYAGEMFCVALGASPLDVVAWVGNSAPCKYDLARFGAINSVSFDHPDPSIFTVLTSPTAIAGTANVDFVIFPPRWLVAEHTFRPPYFHRNTMSEFMGLIRGVYDARQGGFVPGGASLHNGMTPHGPELAVTQRAETVELEPVRMADTLAFMLESPYRLRPTAVAMATGERQRDYASVWQSIPRRFNA